MYNIESLKIYVTRELPEFAKYFGVMSVIFTLPQIAKVWVTHMHHAVGVSLTAFTAYTVIDMIWILYGIKRNDKPIIVSNTLASVANGLVVMGILFNGGATY